MNNNGYNFMIYVYQHCKLQNNSQLVWDLPFKYYFTRNRKSEYLNVYLSIKITELEELFQ